MRHLIVIIGAIGMAGCGSSATGTNLDPCPGVAHQLLVAGPEQLRNTHQPTAVELVNRTYYFTIDLPNACDTYEVMVDSVRYTLRASSPLPDGTFFVAELGIRESLYADQLLRVVAGNDTTYTAFEHVPLFEPTVGVPHPTFTVKFTPIGTPQQDSARAVALVHSLSAEVWFTSRSIRQGFLR